MKTELSLCLLIVLCATLVSCTQSNVSLHKHEYSSSEIAVQPTCTDPGKLVSYCNCGFALETEISPLGHAYTVKGEVVPPTCTEYGISVSSCKLCGDEKYERESKSAHTLGSEFTISETHHAKICTICGQLTERREHVFLGDTCIECNLTKQAISESSTETGE